MGQCGVGGFACHGLSPQAAKKQSGQRAAPGHRTYEVAPEAGGVRLGPCFACGTGRLARWASISRSVSEHRSDVCAAAPVTSSSAASRCRHRAGPSCIPTWCFVNSVRSASTVNVRFSVPRSKPLKQIGPDAPPVLETHVSKACDLQAAFLRVQRLRRPLHKDVQCLGATCRPPGRSSPLGRPQGWGHHMPAPQMGKNQRSNRPLP